MRWKTLFLWVALLFFAWVTVGVIVSLITVGPVEETCTTFGGPSPKTECQTELHWLALTFALVVLGSALLGLAVSVLALWRSMHGDGDASHPART